MFIFLLIFIALWLLLFPLWLKLVSLIVLIYAAYILFFKIDYLSDLGKLCIYFSPPGSGKTTFAAALFWLYL